MNESAKANSGYGNSARSALLWAGGFTVARDVIQFGTMLVLVRIVTPTEYGSMALAQAIINLLAIASFGTFVTHTLQIRDPKDVDWQAHFTAATIINGSLFCITLGVAWALAYTQQYGKAAIPLAGLSFVFLIEIPGTLRHRMIEVEHDWSRFRKLLMAGVLSGSIVGIALAILGGGVWALVMPVLLFGVPAALDLFLFARWRPDWTWSWARYRSTMRFGINRMGSGSLGAGRNALEQGLLAGVYDFAALGVFSRAMGLAMLAAGRIGTIAVGSLYPVITRAEPGSERIRRYSGLILRGVIWATTPTAAFLALEAHDVVSLIYGARWTSVTDLLPLATAAVAFAGIARAIQQLLLANNKARACFMLDLIAAVLGVGLAFWLIPIGVEAFLAALSVHGVLMIVLTTFTLLRAGGVSSIAVAEAVVPAAVATLTGIVAVLCLRSFGNVSDVLVIRLLLEAMVFSSTYLLVLSTLFRALLREFLSVAPGGTRIAALIRL
jgi:O-antigen/teichoic acid export membrane protein